MGGRGTYAAGNEVPFTYQTVGKIFGIKVLKGIGGVHGLPEEAHTSAAYIQLKKDGTVHAIRFYGKDKLLQFEIAFHPEPNIDSSGKPVLHYHMYDNTGAGPWHGPAMKVPKTMRKRYGKFFGRRWV